MKYLLKTSFKKGAASFYIVAFATLILMIIAVSFAAVIISEVTRTSNDDLAQSAYDSALAGVEDAKLAFSNYQKCVASGAVAKAPNPDEPLDCGAIIWYVENPDCYMVGNILGRGKGETAVQESSIQGNNMQQFYTCVKIQKELKDYSTTLSAGNQVKVIKASFSEGFDVNRIKAVRFSWFPDASSSEFRYSNYNSSTEKVTFPRAGFTVLEAKPPTISLAMIQTSSNFTLDSFDMTVGSTTNRGMLYLVPSGDSEAAAKNVENNYSAGYNVDRGANYINQNGFLKSNDKTTRNLPYLVYCPENSGLEFACTVTIDLPNPIGGARSNENFFFVVALPYGDGRLNAEEKRISLEFLCAEDDVCSESTIETVDDEGNPVEETSGSNVATLEGTQIEIDSTGRANNLYRRVKARIQIGDVFDLSIMGPLELLGKNETNNPLLNKNLEVTCEWNFPRRGC